MIAEERSQALRRGRGRPVSTAYVAHARSVTRTAAEPQPPWLPSVSYRPLAKHPQIIRIDAQNTAVAVRQRVLGIAEHPLLQRNSSRRAPDAVNSL